MAATPARATRRRPRRGSLERPVDGRLYRSAFLVVSLPLVILAFSSTRPAALPAPILPPNFDGASTRATAVDFARTFPVRPPGSARALAAAGWVREQTGVVRPRGGRGDLEAARAAARQGAAAERLGRRSRTVAGRDRGHGPPRRHGDRAGSERQRDGHRRADRARAKLRPDERRRIARRRRGSVRRTRSSSCRPTATRSGTSARSGSPAGCRSTSSRRSTLLPSGAAGRHGS